MPSKQMNMSTMFKNQLLKQNLAPHIYDYETDSVNETQPTYMHRNLNPYIFDDLSQSHKEDKHHKNKRTLEPTSINVSKQTINTIDERRQ
jgi:hypothetical protein